MSIQIGSLYKFVKTNYPPLSGEDAKIFVDMSDIIVSCRFLDTFTDSGWDKIKINKDGEVCLATYYEVKIDDIVLVCDIVEIGKYKISALDKQNIEKDNSQTMVIFLLKDKYYEVGADVFSFISEKLV